MSAAEFWHSHVAARRVSVLKTALEGSDLQGLQEWTDTYLIDKVVRTARQP